MKRLLKLILLLVLIIFAATYCLFRPLPVQPPSVLPSVDFPQNLDQLATIEFQSTVYNYSYAVIADPSRLQLFLNHKEKTSSADLFQVHHCSVLVNGNFYDTNDQPLGWLVSQGITLSPPLKSGLFNGFFSLVSNQPYLGLLIPSDPVDLGLQSGPLLILNSTPLNLKLTSDQPRRRMILALNHQSQIVFLTLTSPESTFSGPLLADTPALTLAVAEAINQHFVSALNLDGGSASAFHSGSIHLNELDFIGTFFCYNNSI